MRKLFTLLTTLVIVATQAVAQTWIAPGDFAYNDETIVYATVQLNGGTPGADNADFSLAAFIDGDCRAVCLNAGPGQQGTTIFVLRVHGDRRADQGKTITFAARSKRGLSVSSAVANVAVTFNSESWGLPSQPLIIRVTASNPIPLTGLVVDCDALTAGVTGQMRLTPVPADATFNPSDLRVSIRPNASFDPWNIAECRLVSEKPIVFNVLMHVFTDAMLRITLNGEPLKLMAADGSQADYFPLTACFGLNLHDGWQWRSNPCGSLMGDGIETVYGGNLIELRTQHDLLYNDPDWGYFGTLIADGNIGLQPFTAYKVKMKGNHSARLQPGGIIEGTTLSLHQGWNWIPARLYFDREPEHVWPAALQRGRLPVGTVIVTKEDGVIEWDGTQWVGDLNLVKANDSYLCFNPDANEITLTYADERLTLPMGNEQPAGARLRHQAPPTPLFTMDPTVAHRYRDNITAVISIDGISLNDDFTLGAFVGEECRGIGHVIDGRVFITVHADVDEQVKLRLGRQTDRQLYPIDEQLPTTEMRVGSLSRPMVCHSTRFVQGVEHVSCAPATVRSYDLAGRSLGNRPQHGLVIKRDAQGRVTKTLVR